MKKRKILSLIAFLCISFIANAQQKLTSPDNNLVNVILLVFILLYTNKIAVIAPCKRNRIETKSVF